jgi:putative FmdB family regulatory protein
VPVYEYHCESCKLSVDKIFTASRRPAEIECTGCAGTSQYVISVSRFTDKCFVPVPTHNTEFRGMSMHAFACDACANKFDDMVDFGENEAVSDERKCPECSSTNVRWVPSCRIDRFSETFPYFDRGLGMLLKSKAHRREVCKQRGLTPVEGDWDVDSHLRKWDDEDAKEQKAYDDYCDQLDNDPAFASYRKQEQGLI